jgi:FdhE protein
VSTDVRIVKPGQLEPPVGEIPFLFLPSRDLFASRAERLRFLSRDRAPGEYLAFVAELAEAQHDALNRLPVPALPGPDEQAVTRKRGMPVLDARSLSRDPSWRSGLAMILRRMSEADLPPAARAVCSGLLQADESRLEETADRILAGEFADVPARELPFIAAALQVYWVQMASSMQADAFGRLQHGGQCPACGSHPVAGIVRNNGPEQGLRYLICSLCGSQWHMVRIKCSNCESTEGIDYFTREGSNAAVKAESCSRCKFYLKLLYLGKDPRIEPTADDLATLALDVVMDGKGMKRRGPNLFFHPGGSD